MNRKNLVIAVLVTALIVLAISATWAVAQSTGSVSACVDAKGKVTILGLEENVFCKPDKETEITWSITGPAGEAGPAGESWFDAEIYNHTVNFTAAIGVQMPKVHCDSNDDVLLSGGYSGLDPDTYVIASFPWYDHSLDRDDWNVWVDNRGTADDIISLTARCARRSSP